MAIMTSKLAVDTFFYIALLMCIITFKPNSKVSVSKVKCDRKES